MKKKIFWLAGEKSGDLHAAMVLRYCQEHHPEWEHYGIGGKKMSAAGFQGLFPFERFNVMGFWEVIKHLPFFSKVEKQVVAILEKDKPDLVVLVDYPGLNMRIAKKAKELGLKVLYYICPQFWAWKKHRIFQLGEFTDAIGYILPFEGEFFKEHNISATYTGHPISEEIFVQLPRDEFAKQEKLDPQLKWLGFFPGSRNNEIKKLLPKYLEAIKYLPSEKYEFLVSQSDSVDPELFNQFCRHYKIKNLKIVKGGNYEMMQHCDFLCVTSGTATLETAWLGTPFIICYRTSPINYLIGHYLVKIKWIGLPNIVLGKSIAKELIQKEANAERIAAEINFYLENKNVYDLMRQELKDLQEILGERSASKEVTQLMERLLEDG
ncbi:MAG: lipid-A-disaccharide synthase [Candidatus Cloacimonetes bacterium]|nr:lipid-A-disaccharide synthase [Candidatus Cloacimonadota bacterium]